MSDFVLEPRYIVIKYSDLDKINPLHRHLFMSELSTIRKLILEANCPDRQFLVIEGDWPEYGVAMESLINRLGVDQ